MSYAGDVSCQECWSSLQNDPAAQLVDVRTSAEWTFVGIPFLSEIGKETILAEWQVFPSMQINQGFVGDVENALDRLGIGKESTLFMLCRSGVRSISAAQALSASGYSNAFNVMGGFEGDKNHDQRRGTVSGWKFEKLPWKQN